MSVALPKTYHHPSRGGTGWVSACRVQETSPLRSSSQARKRPIRPPSHHGDRAGEDLDLSPPHPHRIVAQRLGRRSGGDGTVAVEDPAVAGAEEEPRVRDPLHRAAEVGAVDREGGELGGALAP